MSLYRLQNLPAPEGMATNVNRALRKENQCQYLKGVSPARFGIQRQCPRPKLLPAQAFPFMGEMVWLSSDGQLDTLLTVSDVSVGTANASAPKLRSNYVYYKNGSATTPAWNYDEIEGRMRSYYQLGSWSSGISLAQNAGGSPAEIMYVNSWVQMKTELIFSVASGTLYRYYRSEPAGTEFLYTLGLATPSITSLSQSAGGSLTLLGTYEYEITDEDEFGRESSPSAAVSITLTGSNQTVTVTRGTLDAAGGSTHWNVYRKNPGGTSFFFVAQIVSATSTYADTAADTSITANDIAPTAGENDVPNGATIMDVWRDRLILNDVTNPAFFQMSNAGSPTQFSSLPLPTNVADGLTAWAGGKGDNEITGFASLGSLLAIFKRSSMTFLQGDTIENFALLPIHERGCSNHAGIQRCENEIIFPSNDGMYSVLYESGYVLKKLSVEVDDQFTGFAPIRKPGEPTSYGQPLSTEVLMAGDTNVSSFYSRNIYYISFANKTLGFDMVTRGWFDTGWGFVNSAVVYKSQFPLKYASGAILSPSGAPETVFLTRGDYNSNTKTQNYITQLEYFTPVDTMFDIDAPAWNENTPVSLETTRFFDGDGPPQNRTKRAKRFQLWGDTSAKPGQRIGTLRGYADGKLKCVYPIRAYQRIEKSGTIFEQEFDGLMFGQELYFDIEMSYPDVTLGNRTLEYVFVN